MPSPQHINTYIYKMIYIYTNIFQIYVYYVYIWRWARVAPLHFISRTWAVPNQIKHNFNIRKVVALWISSLFQGYSFISVVSSVGDEAPKSHTFYSPACGFISVWAAALLNNLDLPAGSLNKRYKFESRRRNQHSSWKFGLFLLHLKPPRKSFSWIK